MSKSIINEARECYICGSQLQLEHHHCLHGTARRKLAEEDGVWLYLCRKHHEKVHQNHDMDLILQRLGEEAWLRERGYINNGVPHPDGIAEFVKRYGKNYL